MIRLRQLWNSLREEKIDIEFYTMEDLQRIHQEYVKGNVIEFSSPYAISEDKKTMIAYRTCRADRQDDGNLKNVFPNQQGKGNNQIGCLIVSKISDDCKSTCGLPLPDDFPFKEMYFENQVFTLISSEGEAISLMVKELLHRLRSIRFQFKMEDLSKALRTPIEDMYQKKEQSKLPKTISISGIGRFKYDDGSGYRAIIKGVDVSISCEDKREINEVKRRFVEFFNSMEDIIAGAKQYCAKELLDLKNEIWLSEEETALTTAEFVEKLELHFIQMSADNTLIYFGDGDIFWGHEIEVKMDGERQFISGNIVG